MTQTQANEPFETPSHAQILKLTPAHVDAMETSDADSVWTAAGMKHVLLITIGRRSGKAHKTPLPYWLDPAGERIVVASFAGAVKNPAWYHNLADKSANPTVRVKERSVEWDSDAHVLDGDEYQQVWAELTADRPFYRDYQAKTERCIPLVRLPGPKGPDG